MKKTRCRTHFLRKLGVKSILKEHSYFYITALSFHKIIFWFVTSLKFNKQFEFDRTSYILLFNFLPIFKSKKYLMGSSYNNFHFSSFQQQSLNSTVTVLISQNIIFLLKFIYSEKATKFWEISTNYLSYVLPVK